MGLYNRFCKRFFAAVIIRLTAQSDSRAPKLRLHNRFIPVGVDISSYALLTGGWSLYLPVLVKLLYSRGYSGSLVVVIGVCLCGSPSARPCAA